MVLCRCGRAEDRDGLAGLNMQRDALQNRGVVRRVWKPTFSKRTSPSTSVSGVRPGRSALGLHVHDLEDPRAGSDAFCVVFSSRRASAPG